MAVTGERAAAAFHKGIDVLACLPELTASRISVHGQRAPAVTFDLSPYVDDPHEARIRLLSMVDGRRFPDEPFGQLRLSSATHFPDGTGVHVTDQAEYYPWPGRPDLPQARLPERTTTALRNVAEFMGRLVLPISKLSVTIRPPGLTDLVFRDGVERSPISSELELVYASDDEQRTLETWIQQGAIVAGSYTLSAFTDSLPLITWELVLAEGGHPVEVKASQGTPAGVAAHRAVVRDWNEQYPDKLRWPIA